MEEMNEKLLLQSEPLRQLWSEFAGGTAGLALKQVCDDMDEALLAQLPGEDRQLGLSIGSISRRREWAEGRRCRLEAISTVLTRKSSKMHVFHSITHSQGYALAVALGDPALQQYKVRGIGVDLERSDRVISESASHRFRTPAEKVFELSLIDLWVIKEACFKANPDSNGTSMLQYCVSSARPLNSDLARVMDGVLYLNQKENSSFSAEFSFRLVQSFGWTVAFAILKEGVFCASE